MALNTCMRYDMLEGTWQWMPSMREERSFVSSCSLGGYIYVINGKNKYGKTSKIIEKLPVKLSLSEQKQQVWQSIPVSNFRREFTPRILSIACPITSTQILIMGGKAMYGEMQNDVFLFDI